MHMGRIHELFFAHEERLIELALLCAKRQGDAWCASAPPEAWRISLSVFTQALALAEERCGEDAGPLAPGDDGVSDPVFEFVFQEARLHRERGVSLAMFLGLVKCCRRACVDLVRQKIAGVDDMARSEDFVIGFFDRLEVGLCAEWSDVDDGKRLVDLQGKSRCSTREKGRFLTLFESLAAPVFLLDRNLKVEAMNFAAAQLLGVASEPGELSYARPAMGGDGLVGEVDKKPLTEIAPWLRAALDEECSSDAPLGDCRFEVLADTPHGDRHFSVSVSTMSDVPEKYEGYAVALDDISLRVDVERQLERERLQAERYLNDVGAMVVGLDEAGDVAMINETGSQLLGYAQEDLLGRSWVDVALPEEAREEIRDYLYFIVNHGEDGLGDGNARHVNEVVTKSGERRLISWNNRILRNDEGVAVGILSSGMDITDQRHAEEALAKKELWLRNTFVALREAVLILSPERVVLDANPAAEAMFGMERKDILNLPARKLHVDDDHYQRFKTAVNEAFDRGEDASFEFNMRRNSGETFPTEHSVALIKSDDDSVLGAVSVLRDISRRKEAEQVLRRSEEKFRRIFESIEEGYIVTDLKGAVTLVNPATCRLLGYEESELLGSDIRRIYTDPKDRARIKRRLTKVEWVRGAHLSFTRKDGSDIVVEANIHRVSDDAGKPVGLEGTFRDITERIEAEKILREREKQYRAFFENNHAVMLLVDPQTGDIVDANPAASEFYGYSVDAMRTMTSAEISALSEKEIFEEMFRARQEKRAYFLFKHMLASGDVRDVEVYSGPIMVRGNQLLYSVIHDVTDRVRLSAEMERLATTDSLTGAANRHQFFTMAEGEFSRALRYEHPLTVFMLDIDYFKSINDTYGHNAGDAVLRALSTMVVATLRDPDVFGRLGGEEFAAVLPETDIDGGLQVAERLRDALGKLKVEVKGEMISFTASIGVSAMQPEDKLIEDVINRADEALYKAKRMGRNRVEKS